MLSGVKARMVVLGAVALSASAAIAMSSMFGMARMGELQQEAAQRAADAVLAEEGAMRAAKLYQVFADSIINRELDEAEKQWRLELAKTAEVLTKLDGRVDTEAEETALGRVRARQAELAALYAGEVVPLLRIDEFDPVELRAHDGEADRLVAEMEKDLLEISESFAEEAREAGAAFDMAHEQTGRRNLALSAAVLLVLALVSLKITRDLLRQLGGEPAYAMEVAQRIARGDLQTDVRVAAGDEKSLLAAMRTMQRDLAGLVGGIQDSALRVASAASQLKDAAGMVAVASQQESDSAASMSAAVEEMTVSIGQVSDGAVEASDVAADAGRMAAEGARVVDDAGAEIREIAQEVGRTAEQMALLGEQSQQITIVVNVIREIADQTNLLALNAAIEAARAGEQGRGFAVVADEVRKLAERTAHSTAEISAMVDSIQRNTAEALNRMALGRERVDVGVTRAAEAGSSISLVQESAQRVVGAVSDISDALREQRAASNQIAQSVERIAQMAEEANAATQQIADASDNLESLASSLKQMAGRFRVSAST